MNDQSTDATSGADIAPMHSWVVLWGPEAVLSYSVSGPAHSKGSGPEQMANNYFLIEFLKEMLISFISSISYML